MISNTTVLSNFAAIGQVALLRRLFGKLYLPTEVYEEIRDGLAEGYRFYEGFTEHIYPFETSGWLHLTTVSGKDELRDLTQLPQSLHAGESACLVIARHRNWLLLTDDRRARRVAAKWQIDTSGSVGCLVLAVEHGLCSLAEANGYLSQMIRLGYYSPHHDLSSLVDASFFD